jgi:phosphohistidine phosphatase SixA
VRTIFLIRHAKAYKRENWNDFGKKDASRPLLKEGIEEFDSLVSRYREMDRIEKIYSSEYIRAKQTTEIIIKHYSIPVEYQSKINHGCPPKQILDFLLLQKEQVIAYIGHEPEISIMLNLLTGSHFQVHIKKGCIAKVKIEKGESGILESLLYPKLINRYFR